jgi:chromate transporter
MWALAREFAFLGAPGFGGYLGLLIERRIVERHRWLDAVEFAAASEAAAIAPGGTSTALIVEIGRRLRGRSGAAVAMVCAVTPGTLFVISLLSLYIAHQGDRWVRGAIEGAAAGGVAVLVAYVINLWRMFGSSWIDAAGGAVVLVAAVVLPTFVVLVVSMIVSFTIITVHHRRRPDEPPSAEAGEPPP